MAEYHAEQGNPARKSVLGKVLGAAAVLAAVGALIKTYGAHRRKIAEQKEAATKDSSYKVYEVFCNGKSIEVTEGFAGADIRCFVGGICLDLSKAELEKDVYIDLHNSFGGIEIKLPEGVNVSDEATCICGGVAKLVDDYEGEDVRTVHITGKTFFGGLAIRTEAKKHDIVGDYFEEESLKDGEFKQYI
ncbi:MAG: hypothetical protein IJY09_11280 [Lachnospiraceae bacterium]|nr:hypothetical protein [Lachnospiraceae bacterium]